MSAVVIPTRTDLPSYTVRVDLTGVEFLFDFHYNQREAAWYFSLYDSLNEAIAQSIKIVVGLPFMRNIVDQRKPVGALIAIDTTDQDLDPSLEELGSRVLLVYEDGL